MTRFQAFEFHSDQTLQQAVYALEGSERRGWQVFREGQPVLRVGPGYRLLKSERCGVCSTDLARAFLPFPLPQITGHEVTARDEDGKRYAVEINASHAARGVSSGCVFCTRGLAHHCPDRLVLGIHDLPGGFGPWILAPLHALHRLPTAFAEEVGVLIEPLAAALNAVTSLDIRQGDKVAVLGPRKLGLMAVAALAAYRSDNNLDYEISALARRPALLELSAGVGADKAVDVSTSEPPELSYDIVIDTTGSTAGFETALRLTKRELHLKSTNGQPAGGVAHLTEAVVDELNLERFDPAADLSALPGRGKPLVGWLASSEPNAETASNCEIVRAKGAAELLEALENEPPADGLPRVDAVVTDATPDAAAAAVRPREGSELSPVRPRGRILLDGEAQGGSSLIAAMQSRGVKLTSSRCGDFSDAIRLMLAQPKLAKAGEAMITDRFGADQVPEAFETARSKKCIKAVVEHLS